MAVEMLPLYIDEKQASSRYSFSPSWFQRKRWTGDGPPYLKRGRKILYPLKEVDEWFIKHGLQYSTEENIKK